jgi:hypothetical protein
VSAAFVAETIVTAIDAKTGEVFMPPTRRRLACPE